MESLAFLGASMVTASLVSRRLSAKSAAPRAKREAARVLIGAVEGQNRGPSPMSPPVALVDDLFWLRDDSRTSAEVLTHLRAENAFTEFKTAHLQPAVGTLYAELLSRMKESDASVPYAHGPFAYYTRTEKGKSYTIHCRVPRTGGGQSPVAPTIGLPLHLVRAADGGALHGEVAVLDENILASGHSMCDVASVEASPDHVLLAYTVDFSGYETYELHFKLAGDETPQLGGAGVKPHPAGGGLGAGPASPAGLSDVLVGVDGDFVWGGDNTTVYYKTFDAAHRPHKVWRHVLGTAQAEDMCLFTEEDEKFWVGMSKSSSGAYIFIEAASKTTAEVHAVRLTPHGEGCDPALVAAEPCGRPRLVAPRTQGVLYEVEHYQPPPSPATTGGGFFVVTTNAGGAKNFKVCLAPLATPSPDHWVDLLPSSPALNVTGVHVFQRFLAVYGREGGYKNIWLLSAAAVTEYYAAAFPGRGAVGARVGAGSVCAVDMRRVPPRHAVFVVGGAGGNEEYAAGALRFKYGSPVSPECTCEVDVEGVGFTPAHGDVGRQDGQWRGVVVDAPGTAITVLKEKAVPNCEPWRYATARVWATGKDGTRVPVSVVYKPEAHGLSPPARPAEGSGAAWTPVLTSAGGGAAAGAGGGPAPACPLPRAAPTLLYGYGSYGHSIDMWFSSATLSLVDRGIVYAVAHVRGGGEMGRAWYEDEGKLMAKQNTFDDFFACGEHLLGSGWTSPGRLGAMGASAGGLLMGVCLNTRPDLFGAVVSQVGFVDVLQSVADPSIPLAVTEWEEWGNPNERAAFEYMRTYSPLDNTRKGVTLPPTLLTAGWNDSRVAYWEAAKFAQRLRDANAGPHDVLLKVDLGAGHFSYSDRYAYIKDKAFEYAWLADALGVPVTQARRTGSTRE